MIKDFLTTAELNQLLPGDGRPVTLTAPEAAALRSHVFSVDDKYRSLLRRVLTDHGRNAPVHRQLAPGLMGEIEEAVGLV